MKIKRSIIVHKEKTNREETKKKNQSEKKIIFARRNSWFARASRQIFLNYSYQVNWLMERKTKNSFDIIFFQLCRYFLKDYFFFESVNYRATNAKGAKLQYQEKCSNKVVFEKKSLAQNNLRTHLRRFVTLAHLCVYCVKLITHFIVR